MKKIYESIEIETWKKIAQRVQKLDFSNGDCYSSEFTENLKKLKRLLSDLDICLDDLSREPKKEEEIGLASLLQAIYDSDEGKYYKKAHFYEKIYQISELGIQYIEFSPVEFYESNHSIQNIYNEKTNISTIGKFYTDGDFQLKSSAIVTKTKSGYEYTMWGLNNANYVIFTTLLRNWSSTNKKAQVELAQAALKNFNGIFPSKEEMMSFEFPELLILEQSGSWDVVGSLTVREKYSGFDDSTSDYRKQLTRRNNQWYYKNPKM